MIGQILYIALFTLVAGFIWWRFYVSMRDQKASVRGAVYVKGEQPIQYWLSTSMMAIGALLISLVALVFIYGAIAGPLD
jgi:hypothetical protein